jgi:hypothetical protein
VLNGVPNEENRRAIEFYGEVSVIAEVGPIGDLSIEGLRRVAGTIEGVGSTWEAG